MVCIFEIMAAHVHFLQHKLHHGNRARWPEIQRFLWKFEAN